MADRLALSVRQPWAWLIVHGWKPIENRSWGTTYRGPLQIHAGKTLCRADWDAACLFVAGFDGGLARRIPEPRDLPRGCIVGFVNLIEVITPHDVLDALDDVVTHADLDWYTGEYGLVMCDAQPVPPVPCKGALGLFQTATEVAHV